MPSGKNMVSSIALLKYFMVMLWSAKPPGKTTRLYSDYNQLNVLKLPAGPQSMSHIRDVPCRGERIPEGKKHKKTLSIAEASPFYSAQIIQSKQSQNSPSVSAYSGQRSQKQSDIITKQMVMVTAGHLQVGVTEAGLLGTGVRDKQLEGTKMDAQHKMEFPQPSQ